VAHRGYALHYPENSIEGISAALDVGAKYIEFDLHLSADEVPMVFHDAQLFRTTGELGIIFETPLKELRKLDANEPNRFRNSIRNIQIPTLQEMVKLLQAWPDVTAFVELKRASLNHFGQSLMLERVMHALQPILSQAIIISFDIESLYEARHQGAQGVGWVIEEWGEAAHQAANTLQPEYLICNYTKLPKPPTPLWPGSWQWAVYETVDVDIALALAERNITLIETMAIGQMLDDPRLKQSSKNG